MPFALMLSSIHGRACVPARFFLLLLLGVPPIVNPQGLVKNPDAIVSANNAYTNIKKQMQMGSNWRKEFRDNPKAACSSGKASLCSSNPEVGSEVDPDETLFWATVPPVYDQRNPKHTGGFNAVSRPLNQGKCFTCASFAVASAAETAIALTLRRNATHMLSVQVSWELIDSISAKDASQSNSVQQCAARQHVCVAVGLNQTIKNPRKRVLPAPSLRGRYACLMDTVARSNKCTTHPRAEVIT